MGVTDLGHVAALSDLKPSVNGKGTSLGVNCGSEHTMLDFSV
jgi:hypothetical protein